MIATADLTPAISWKELETLLLDLADTETKRMMVRHLVEGTRKQAVFLSPAGTINEIIHIGAALLDASFNPPSLTASSSCAFCSSSRSPP